MEPFLKWAGGKRWLASKSSDWFEVGPSRYIEPFLGSGAIYFHLMPESAILSDLNKELIETYEAIRGEPGKVFGLLKAHHRKHSAEYYYVVRAQNPRNSYSRAARFIYLNRTCFNGLYRVNKKGEFNVPKGSKNSVVFDYDNFQAIANQLSGTELNNCDFADSISKAEKGDLLFADPPYTVKHNNNNFLKYNEHIFSWADQERLAKAVNGAARRGAKVLVSNADHKCIHELYSQNRWEILRVERYSGLASSSEFRKSTSEVVISNYLSPTGEVVRTRR